MGDATSEGLKYLLRDTRLRLTLRSPSGGERHAECAVYNGIACGKSWTEGGARAGIENMANDCTFEIDSGGRYELRGTVKWPERRSPARRLRRLLLEVRKLDRRLALAAVLVTAIAATSRPTNFRPGS